MYIIRYLENYRIIRVAFFGVLHGMDNFVPMMKDLIATIEEHSCFRMLFDLRKTRITDDYMELFNVGINASEYGYKRDYKTAILFSDDEQKFNVLEKILTERSYDLQLFRNENAALIWLNQTDNSDTPDSGQNSTFP
ncbi:hypothetical protein [uncultured Desulfuromusa sp.]|uniref:hypothetical protein n=1 Tax=uncultured Desulfuromusa sp. TaxID=219183 RepID=UPI002AA763FC|nr:hypothetical protein [uncultured Desulfuromusa sp.]